MGSHQFKAEITGHSRRIKVPNSKLTIQEIDLFIMYFHCSKHEHSRQIQRVRLNIVNLDVFGGHDMLHDDITEIGEITLDSMKEIKLKPSKQENHT